MHSLQELHHCITLSEVDTLLAEYFGSQGNDIKMLLLVNIAKGLQERKIEKISCEEETQMASEVSWNTKNQLFVLNYHTAMIGKYLSLARAVYQSVSSSQKDAVALDFDNLFVQGTHNFKVSKEIYLFARAAITISRHAQEMVNMVAQQNVENVNAHHYAGIFDHPVVREKLSQAAQLRAIVQEENAILFEKIKVLFDSPM